MITRINEMNNQTQYIDIIGLPSGSVIEIIEPELYKLIDMKLIQKTHNISHSLYGIKYIFHDKFYDDIIKFLIK